MEDLVLSCLESRVEANRNLYTRFLVGPFLKGDALTVATALRRVLLSSVESIGITALYIQGITHEFSIIAGVRESVLELSLNFQAIVLCYDKSFLKKKNFFDDIQIGYLQVQGPKVVYANDLKLPLGIKLVDPTQYIATVSKEGSIVLKFIIGKKNNFLRSSALTVPCRAFTPRKKVRGFGQKGETKSSFASTKEGQKLNSPLPSPCYGKVRLWQGAPLPPQGVTEGYRSKVRRCNNLYKEKSKICKEVKQQNISIYTLEPDSVFSMNNLSLKSKATKMQSSLKTEFAMFLRSEATDLRSKLQTSLAILPVGKPLGERFERQMTLRGSSICGANCLLRKQRGIANCKLCLPKSFGKHKKEFIYFPFLGQLSKKNITRAKKGYLYKDSSAINHFRTITWLANKAKLTFSKKQSFSHRRCTPLRGSPPHLRYGRALLTYTPFQESKIRRGNTKQRTYMHEVFQNKQRYSGRVDLRGIKDDLKRRLIALASNKKNIKTKDCIQTFNETIGSSVKQLKFNCFKSSKESTFLSKNKVFKSDICLRNIIPLDLTLTPVLKVNFVIEIDDDVLYLRQKVRERIILEVWTNGSIHPRQAVHDAALSLTDMFATFRSVYQVQSTFLPLFKINQFNKTSRTHLLPKVTPKGVGVSAFLWKKLRFQSSPFGDAHVPYGHVKCTTKPLVEQKAEGIKSFHSHTYLHPLKGVRGRIGNKMALRGSFFTKSFGKKKVQGAPPLHITDVHVHATQRGKKGVELYSTNMGDGTARLGKNQRGTHDAAKALYKKKRNNNFVYKTKLERNSLFFSDMGSLALPVNIYSFLKKKGIKKFLTLNNLSSFDLLLLLKGNTEMFYTVKRCLSKNNFSNQRRD